jgi:hypothetical protein
MTLHNLGFAYYSFGDKQKALDYYNQSLARRQATGERRGEAATFHEMSGIHYDLGEDQKAFHYLAKALHLSRAVGDRRIEAAALAGVAVIAHDRKNFIAARSHLDSALVILESSRAKIAGEGFRASYFASMYGYYEYYIDLLMHLHQQHSAEEYAIAALEASERARARTLLEILNEARADIRQGIDPALLTRERELQRQINVKEQTRIQLLSGKHIERPLAAIKKEIEDLLTQYQEVQAQIRTGSPRYAALTQPHPLRLKEIQEQVLDDDTMLLEYALGEERSFLWAVMPTSIFSFVLPKRAVIDSLARRVYALLTAPNECITGETDSQKCARIAAAMANYPEAAAELSRMLLEPVASHLGSKRLLIVAEGALQYIPFAALPVPTASDQLSVSSGQKKLNTDHWSLKTDYRPFCTLVEWRPRASLLLRRRRNG